MFLKSKMALAVGTALLVAGCGGGGGGSTPSETPSTSEPVSISGRAADGYLVYANVCADLNANGTCDAGEPNTTTGTGGVFTLDLPADAVNAALVVEAIANLTVDEDNGQPIPSGFTLRAPIDTSKEQQFVSPVTTMVANEMAKGSGQTLEQAKQAVASRLQTSFDVMGDYVAAAADGTDESAQQNAERLHRIAQVTARVSAQLEGQIDQASLDQLGLTKQEYLDLVLAQVEALLTVILTDVDATLGDDNFDPDAILETPDYDVSVPTPVPTPEDPSEPTPPTGGDTLSDRIAQADSANPFFRETPSGLQALADSKLHHTEFEANTVNPGSFHYVALQRWLQVGSDNTGFLSLSEYASRNQDTGVGSEFIPADTLNARIWANSSHGLETITEKFISGQDVTAEGANLSTDAYNAKLQTSASFTAVDLSGLPTVATIPQLFSGISADDLSDVSSSAIFPDGSMAYMRSETFDNDLFITSWHGVTDGGWSGQATVCSPNADISVVQSCNVVYGSKTVDSIEMPAQTFGELMYANQFDPTNRTGGLMGFSVNGTSYAMALFGDVSNGSGDIKIYGFSEPEGEVEVASGSWDLVAQPFEHVRLNLPDGYRYHSFMDTYGGEGYAFLHEYQGYVRAGRFTPAGTEVATYFERNPAQLELNDTAMSHVLQSLESWNLLSEHPGWSSED